MVQLDHLCRKACGLAAAIVSEPSPEKSLLGITGDSNTPQMILRKSFRTIKEATFLLVQLSKRFLDTQDEETSINFAESVGDLLCHQLLTIRHKGAFMSVEETFGLLCKTLASSSRALNYNLLEKWLKVFLFCYNTLTLIY